jgi:CO/xanthine dehydrogenase FAD-binding subunit
MARKFEVSQIYFPPALNDLLSLRNQRPDAVLFAGGTWLVRNQGSRFLRLPEAVISLHTIEELSRIGRTESRIDIGSTATLKRILKIGRNLLPRIFFETLEEIVPPSVLSLATLGGNICVRDRAMTSYPTLHILDAKLEFRKLGGSRWVPATAVRDAEGRLIMGPGEVLTRIRIPIESWNVQYFRRIGPTPYTDSTESLVFSAVARTNRGIIGDLRFAVGSNRPIIYRERDLETTLIGRRLPLSSRDVSLFIEALRENLESPAPGFTPFQRDRVLSLVEWIITNLPMD